MEWGDTKCVTLPKGPLYLSSIVLSGLFQECHRHDVGLIMESARRLREKEGA